MPASPVCVCVCVCVCARARAAYSTCACTGKLWHLCAQHVHTPQQAPLPMTPLACYKSSLEVKEKGQKVLAIGEGALSCDSSPRPLPALSSHILRPLPSLHCAFFIWLALLHLVTLRLLHLLTLRLLHLVTRPLRCRPECVPSPSSALCRAFPPAMVQGASANTRCASVEDARARFCMRALTRPHTRTRACAPTNKHMNEMLVMECRGRCGCVWALDQLSRLSLHARVARSGAVFVIGMPLRVS